MERPRDRAAKQRDEIAAFCMAGKSIISCVATLRVSA